MLHKGRTRRTWVCHGCMGGPGLLLVNIDCHNRIQHFPALLQSRKIPDHFCKLAKTHKGASDTFKCHLQLHAEGLLATSDKDRLNDMYKQNEQDGNMDVASCGEVVSRHKNHRESGGMWHVTRILGHDQNSATCRGYKVR